MCIRDRSDTEVGDDHNGPQQPGGTATVGPPGGDHRLDHVAATINGSRGVGHRHRDPAGFGELSDADDFSSTDDHTET